jgi:hypothetical protein
MLKNVNESLPITENNSNPTEIQLKGIFTAEETILVKESMDH